MTIYGYFSVNGPAVSGSGGKPAQITEHSRNDAVGALDIPAVLLPPDISTISRSSRPIRKKNSVPNPTRPAGPAT